MPNKKVVIAVYDSTTTRCLKPLGDDLRSDVDVEYLLLDELLPRSAMDSSLSEDEFRPHRRASDYVNSDLLQKCNEIEHSHPIAAIIIQRLIEDNISPQLSYDISGYLDDADPDVFVCGHDVLPFIKHIIEESHYCDFKSVVVQHGINRPDLEEPSSRPGVPDVLSPSVDPDNQWLEYIKRRVGFRYGPFQYCNPYVDELYTLGEFFSRHIRNLRTGYPTFGKTDIVTTGSIEYDPDTIIEYTPEVSSVLFLSEYQFDQNVWNDRQQSYIVTILENIRETNNVNITVRPHPKESRNKVNKYFSDFEISENSELESDVDEHDAVITVGSTAIFSGVLRGKVCGIIQTPWNEIVFEPFTHQHIIELTEKNVDIIEPANRLSTETQKEYLRECCYVPAYNRGSDYESSLEYISKRILDLIEK